MMLTPLGSYFDIKELYKKLGNMQIGYFENIYDRNYLHNSENPYFNTPRMPERMPNH